MAFDLHIAIDCSRAGNRTSRPKGLHVHAATGTDGD